MFYDRGRGQYLTDELLPVSFRELRRFELQVLREARSRLQSHAVALLEGRLDIRGFQQSVINTLKERGIQLTILGAGGSEQVTDSMWQELADHLADVFDLLDGFAIALANGELTEKQVVARARQYSGELDQDFHTAWMAAQGEAGYVEARRSLTEGFKHCEECKLYDTLGQWIPIEQVVPIATDCRCNFNCKCTIEIRRSQNISNFADALRQAAAI